jgi:hypothetical protein
MNGTEDAPPPVPIQLTWCITPESRIDEVVQKVVNSHFQDCPQRLEVAADCRNSLCRYFTWHLNHHTAHRPGVLHYCQHCALFETWIKKHSRHYCRSPCGLSLCNQMKVSAAVTLRGHIHSSWLGKNTLLLYFLPNTLVRIHQTFDVPMFLYTITDEDCSCQSKAFGISG